MTNIISKVANKLKNDNMILFIQMNMRIDLVSVLSMYELNIENYNV